MNRFSLAERVALITGGNRGLGRAMALALQEAGARVAVTGRDRERNAAVAAELIDGDAAVHEVDVRDEAAVERAVAMIAERFGRLDILVNNAGTVWNGPVTDIQAKDWDEVVESNLTGPFICTRHAARAMIDGGEGGKIINIGSIYSLLGPPSYASYAASKAGLLGLTRGLAMELAPPQHPSKCHPSRLVRDRYDQRYGPGSPPRDRGANGRRTLGDSPTTSAAPWSSSHRAPLTTSPVPACWSTAGSASPRGRSRNPRTQYRGHAGALRARNRIARSGLASLVGRGPPACGLLD